MTLHFEIPVRRSLVIAISRGKAGCWEESAMDEPLGLQSIMIGTLSGAAIVLTGAFYALFFALGRLHESRALIVASIVSFALLAVATYAFAMALELRGIWIVVTAVMLTGYFVAPRAIWRLCVGTHEGSSPINQSRATQ